MREDAKGYVFLTVMLAILFGFIALAVWRSQTAPCSEFASGSIGHVPVRCAKELGVAVPLDPGR